MERDKIIISLSTELSQNTKIDAKTATFYIQMAYQCGVESKATNVVSRAHRKPVVMCDVKGGEIQSFISMLQATEKTGINQRSIKRSLTKGYMCNKRTVYFKYPKAINKKLNDI